MLDCFWYCSVVKCLASCAVIKWLCSQCCVMWCREAQLDQIFHIICIILWIIHYLHFSIRNNLLVDCKDTLSVRLHSIHWLIYQWAINHSQNSVFYEFSWKRTTETHHSWSSPDDLSAVNVSSPRYEGPPKRPITGLPGRRMSGSLQVTPAFLACEVSWKPEGNPNGCPIHGSKEVCQSAIFLTVRHAGSEHSFYYVCVHVCLSDQERSCVQYTLSHERVLILGHWPHWLEVLRGRKLADRSPEVLPNRR